MSENEGISQGISRRGFITRASFAAAGVAALGLAGCSSGSQSSSGGGGMLAAADDGKWDSETEVVIVGGGGAGLTAAVVAAKGGAKVTVIEAAEKVGGNTINSSGVIQAAGTELQKSYAKVTDDTPEKHAQYYLACGEGQLDESLVKYACEQAPAMIAFMQDLGVKYEVCYGNGPIPNVSEDYRRPRIHLAGTSENDLQYGVWHVSALEDAAKKAGVTFAMKTTVTQLVQNSDGVITGVVAGDKKYKATKGVILATCSFDRNEEMAKAFSTHMLGVLKDKFSLTAATNTGDGIKLGMSVGADLTGFGGFIGLSNNIGGTPTLPIVPEVPGIIVNKYGRRFVSESDHYAWVLRAIFAQEDRVAYGIIDSKAAALTGAVVGGVHPFSDNFEKEIADGTAWKGNTVAELAAAMKVNPEALQHEIDTWNRDMAAGQKDSQFPTRSAGLQPLDTAPFYATRMYDYNLGALGGLKIDTGAHVLNINGEPIKHLYAAGQVAGGFMGSYYPGTGTGILSTLVFGTAAANSVLAEEAVS